MPRRSTIPAPARARVAWLAPAAWILYVLLPAPGQGLLHGFPVRPIETAAIAALLLAHLAWRPKWPAALAVACLAAKLALVWPAAAERGLIASYFANETFAPPAARGTIDRTLDFRPEVSRGLPLSFLPGDGHPFSVWWTGFLRVPRDEPVTVFVGGRDVTGTVAIDGVEVAALRPGAADRREPVVLRAGWRRLDVTLAASGTGRTFYSGIIEASGTVRPFGDRTVYRHRVSDWRLSFDRAADSVAWALDFAVLSYLAGILGLALARSDILDGDGLTLGLIGLGVGLLFVVVPHGIDGDARVRFDALSALLEHGRVPAIVYSMVGPLFSAPLYYLGTLAYGPEWWCARYNAVLLAIGLVALDRLLASHVERRLRWTFLLMLVAASMFPKHVRGYDTEMFTAMCAATGIAALVSDRIRLGWTLLVLGVVNTPAALVGLFFVAADYVWTTKRVRHFLAVAAAAALIMLESWIRRGGPFVTGYEGNSGGHTIMPYSGLPGFSYPLFFGLLSVLLSFGKGLLFYAPGLIVPIDRSGDLVSNRLGAAYRMCLGFVAGLLLVYAKWWAWYGGWTWGPRFFLFASVPASLAVAVKLRQTSVQRLPWLVALPVLVGLSVWVAVDGAVFEQNNLVPCLQNGYAQEFLCWYAPEFSALWRPFVAPTPLSFRELGFAAYALAAFVWLAAPPLARMAAMWREADLGNARAAITSLRF